MPKLLLDQSAHHIIWNLFLATVPVVLAFLAPMGIRNDVRTAGRIRWVIWTPLLVAWLLFLPNTVYLLTEWRHYVHAVTGYREVYYGIGLASPTTGVTEFQKGRTFYYRVDPGVAKLTLLSTTVFFLFYTWYGVVAFFLAIWQIARVTRGRLGRFEPVFLPGVCGLCALGIYLGLVIRFNSWQVARPHRLVQILSTVVKTFGHPLTTAVIIGVGFTLWVMYVLFDIWMDGAALRFRRRFRTAAGDDMPTGYS